MVGKKKYQKLIGYIDASWDELTVSTPQDSDSHFALPHPFVAPSVNPVDGFVFKEQFYWDTYFTVIGLMTAGKTDLALGMISNLQHLQRKFGYIPNSSNAEHIGRSQPPFMSSMVLIGYSINKDKRWLQESLDLLEAEYHTVWRGHDDDHRREVYSGLSRYFHQTSGHFGAEEESGWDHTNRFGSKALDYLPIDLNSLLYKYEIDIALINEILGHASPDWYRLAETRSRTINNAMWDASEGLFFDYNYQDERRGTVMSLATYTPLFTGQASMQQAQQLVVNLQKFQTEHGLTTTAIEDTDDIAGHQWMSPNGWAPLHFIVAEGLRRYGYEHHARQIAQAWVNTVNTTFLKSGKIQEKYNVVNLDQPPVSAIYPDQVGFAWTNAITLYFINSYLD